MWKKILCLVAAMLLFTIPVYAEEDKRADVPYIPDGYTEEQWNSMSNDEQWDAFYAQSAVCDIKEDEFINYDTGSVQLMCMADAGILNCNVMTLIFYNINDGNYYWVNVSDFDTPVITLPVGTYTLDCVQYDGQSSVNLRAELDPEYITVIKDTLLNPDAGIFLYISVAYEEYEQNMFKTNICAYDKFGGTVSFDLTGESDVVSDTREHTYHIQIQDGKVMATQRVYTGSYHIRNVEVTDTSGKPVSAYYDSGEIYITRNTDVTPETTLYIYRTKEDLPSDFISVLSDEYNTYVSTEDSNEYGWTVEEPQEENTEIAVLEKEAENDNETHSNPAAKTAGILVIVAIVFLAVKYRKEIINIIKSIFR